METAFCPWKVELHENQRDDFVLFLQKHVVHNSPVPERILLRLLGSDNLRRRVCDIIQSDFHSRTADSSCSTLTRRKLHFPLKPLKQIRAIIPLSVRKKHDFTDETTSGKVHDKQVLL